MNCIECLIKTTNPKFCSRSCSATWNNRNHPKRKLTKTCKKCSTKIKSSNKYCSKCYKSGIKTPGYCQRHKINRPVVNNKIMRCKKCAVEAVSETRRRNKSRLIKLFGGACQSCSYNKYHGALQFHHKDESNKSFAISAKGSTKSFDRLFEESKKCVLLCGNCHTEVHAKILDISNFRVGPTDKPGFAPGPLG